VDDDPRLRRSALWASAGFYALVTLEFFYMVTPFAAYVYAIYGPSFDVLNAHRFSAWLAGTHRQELMYRSISLSSTVSGTLPRCSTAL
jgi:hypothetical protein